MLRFVIWTCLAVGLAGCATHDMPLSSDQIAALRVVDVSVGFEPDARTSYIDPKPEERVVGEAARAKAAADRTQTPELQERERLATLLRNTVQQRVVPSFQSGTRPVVLELRIKKFLVEPPVQRAVLGLGNHLHAIIALKDASTGAELARLDQPVSYAPPVGLIGLVAEAAVNAVVPIMPADERLVDIQAATILTWLLKK